jgi:hypothetical protein
VWTEEQIAAQKRKEKDKEGYMKKRKRKMKVCGRIISLNLKQAHQNKSTKHRGLRGCFIDKDGGRWK